MAVYSKQILSGAVNGQPIVVTGLAPSTANIVHTAVTDSGSGQMDEIHVMAYCMATADSSLVLWWGASATGQNTRKITHVIPSLSGLHLVSPGLPLRGGNVVKAYATAADIIGLVGWVNRVT